MSSYRITRRISIVRPAPEPATEPPLPPMRKMVRNAAAAALQTVRQVAAGMPLLVSSDEAERRRTICEGCQKWFRASDYRCSHPGCGCRMRLKTWLYSQQCPAGNW